MSKTHYVTTNFLVDEVNYVLKHPESSRDERHGLITLLESALFEAGAYNGYMYLSPDSLDVDVTPGVRYIDGIAVFRDTDPTRRKYTPS